MKTAKEFWEKLTSDEAFEKKVSAQVQAKMDAGAEDYTDALIPAFILLKMTILKNTNP